MRKFALIFAIAAASSASYAQEEMFTLRLSKPQLDYIGKLIEQRPISEANFIYQEIQRQILSNVAEAERAKRQLIENELKKQETSK